MLYKHFVLRSNSIVSSFIPSDALEIENEKIHDPWKVKLIICFNRKI